MSKETREERETRGINILLKALCSIKTNPDRELAIKALYEYETLLLADYDEDENDRNREHQENKRETVKL